MKKSCVCHSFEVAKTRICHAGSLPLAYNNGGAPTAIWGWVLVSGMTMTVVRLSFPSCLMDRKLHHISECRVITEACIPTTPSINDFIVMDSRLECCSSVHDVTGADYGGDCVIPAVKWRALLLVSSACFKALVYREAAWFETISQMRVDSQMAPSCRATHLAPRRGKLPAFAGWLTGEHTIPIYPESLCRHM